MNVLLGLCLAALVWSTTRRLFSEGAANFALALFAFSPGLIAHFSLATTDGAQVLFTFATAAQLTFWRTNPSRFQTTLLGLALGGLLASKFSAPPLFTLALALMLVLRPQGVALRPKDWNCGKAAAAAATALLVVWATYRFHVSRVTLSKEQITVTFPNSKPIIRHVSTPLDSTFYFPAGEYLAGWRRLVQHNKGGHRSFFLGKVMVGGSKLYFPVALLLKWPTAVLGLSFTSLLLVLRKRFTAPRGLFLMTFFPVLLFLVAIFSNINIGDRHILPLYPFLLLFCGGIWEFARSHRPMLALAAFALLFQVADGLRYAPDYLSYFNFFVKPENSYKLLADSNLDWGQGLLALREYQRKNPSEIIHLAYFGTVEPYIYGLSVLPLKETDRVSGTIVVSATHLSGQILENPASYQWVLSYPRRSILNHSLHVFEVPAGAAPQ